MLVGQYSPYIIKALDTCDYLPLLSTYSNLYACIGKIIFFALKQNNPKLGKVINENSILGSHFCDYFKEKPVIRCVILLFPGIGNLVIAIYDFANRKYSNKEFMLTEIAKDHKAFMNASLTLRTDLNFLLSAIKENHDVLQYFSNDLLGNNHFIFYAIKINVKAILYLSPEYYKEKMKGLKRERCFIFNQLKIGVGALGEYYHDEKLNMR